MNNKKARILCDRVISYLPFSLREKIWSVLKKREDYPYGLSEIRVRVGRYSSLTVSGENIPIKIGLKEGEGETLLRSLCGGGVYSEANFLKEGYISLWGGVRVGVVAEAKYDDGEVTGIGEARGFIFRIPASKSEVADRIYEEWQREGEKLSGLLLFSAPSGGKTSALRELAGKISSYRRGGSRVVIIDERGEFCEEDYLCSNIDILRGYKKAVGISRALAAFSPDVIIVDEIMGEEDAAAIAEVGRGGVKILASTHAASFDELIRRSWVSKLSNLGILSSFAGICIENGSRSVRFYSLDEGQSLTNAHSGSVILC